LCNVAAVHSDNSFEIFVDQNLVNSGNLLEDMRYGRHLTTLLVWQHIFFCFNNAHIFSSELSNVVYACHSCGLGWFLLLAYVQLNVFLLIAAHMLVVIHAVDVVCCVCEVHR